MVWKAALKSEWIRASAGLGLILAIIFSPAVFGSKTLLMSAWEAPSILNAGAYSTSPITRIGITRTPDPGAPAWQTEPFLKVIADQYWHEHVVPLWNPYTAYGAPLAADMHSQPFFPLTALLTLHLTPKTYNFFVISKLFIAGLLTFLFARLFLSGLPSLLAAVTFMLTGYFITMMDMPHLSVEVLLPGVFLTFEQILRKNSWNSVAMAASMIFLCTVGGMPESLFLVVAFGCVYFLCRLCTLEFRDGAYSRLAKLAASIIFGFALSAFLLLPFVEFIGIGYDLHQTSNVGMKGGLIGDTDYRKIAIYLFPLIFGPIGNSIFTNFSGWTGAWGYWGTLPCFFATSAILFWFFPRKVAHPRSLRLLTGFFAVMLALMVLKRFGNPIINWIGGLPIAEMVLYTKYQEPLMALCVAMLAGIGFSALTENRAKPSYFLAVTLVFLGVMLALAGWSLRMVIAHPQFGFYFYLSVLGGILFVLAAVMMIALICSDSPPRWRPWVMRGLVGLLCLELFMNFIAPSFYIFNSLPSITRDPYVGAPYIDFIRARNADHSRVFGREAILFPDWSAAFKLGDVRNLDAIYYYRYRAFMRNFLLPPGDENRLNGDLADRFTGTDFPYRFDTDVEKRFLALSSIKYLISGTEYGQSSTVVNEIVSQHKGENIWGFGVDLFRIGDGTMAPVPGLFEHPPSSRVSYKTVIDPNQPIFEGVAVIKTEALDNSDGVGFLLEIKSDGDIERLFSTVLNPREVPADRGGRPFRLDLSRYAGKQVELLFSTDPGPSGNNSWDWAGWARLGFSPRDGRVAFNEIYAKEARVYEFVQTLPRASLFRSAEILADGEVLGRLKDPSFNLFENVILSRESLAGLDPAVVRSITEARVAPLSAARITQYGSQHVRIDAETEAPAVLMLNDTNYPGWRAYVNGSLVPMVTANYLFRGVVLPAGKSRVEFIYQPQSFHFGVLISFAALAALAALVILERRRRNGRAVPLSALQTRKP